MDRDLLDHAMKAGYESTHSIITNSRHYGDYEMINCTAKQFIEIMNGDISKYSQILDANQRGVGFAVLVQRKGPDSFIPVAGFNIPNR